MDEPVKRESPDELLKSAGQFHATARLEIVQRVGRRDAALCCIR